MSRKYKLAAAVRVEPNTAFWVRENISGPWSKVTVAEGLWYILGDGTSRDLLAVLEEDINHALSPTSVAFSIVNSATNFKGRVYLENTGSVGFEMNRTDPAASDTDEAQDLWDWFRWTSDLSLNVGGGRFGGYCHAGGLYPEVYALSDEGALMPHVSQSKPDEGDPQTLNVGRAEKHNLSIRLTQSYPRNDTAARNDYHAMRDLMDNFLAKGRPFRFYPDRDVTAAYDEASEQYGYTTYVLDKDSMEWRPDPAFGVWYNAWDMDLEMWTYTGTGA